MKRRNCGREPVELDIDPLRFSAVHPHPKCLSSPQNCRQNVVLKKMSATFGLSTWPRSSDNHGDLQSEERARGSVKKDDLWRPGGILKWIG